MYRRGCGECLQDSKAVEKLERFAANSQNFTSAADEAPADNLPAIERLGA